MAAGAQNARSFIEQGLAFYGRGDLQQALGQWREALRIDPGNDEAKKLVSFVEDRMSAKTPVPPKAHGNREPSPLPDIDESALSWEAPESTSPESGAQTAARLIRAEVQANEASEDSGERKRRPTLISMLPELLAPSTLPEDLRRTATAMVVVPPTAPANEGVPSAVSADVITRQVGTDRPTPQTLNSLSRADTPLDLALAQARDRGKILVRQCREALAAGKPQAAAVAAEEALEEADKAPAPGIAEVIEPARSTLEKAFVAHLGRPGSVPTMAVDDAIINTSNFDHRTGFLLSCIDGTLPIETLIDISGMGRFEAVRTLSKLLHKRIIKVS